MSTEIERKFLVKNDAWRTLGTPTRIVQGYLSTSSDRVVRIRTADENAFLTIKGAAQGISRLEFEYCIPVEEARQMLDLLCLKPLIVKTRHTIRHSGSVWEIDEYQAPRNGLVIAEIELQSIDEAFEIPPWIGAEVSGNPDYYNHTLLAELGG